MSASFTTLFLTVEDLAQRWRRSAATIRSDVHRSPSSLPPIFKIPGTRRLIWRIEDVERFEAECVKQVAPPEPSRGRARGRPTKAEVIRRRQAGGP